MGTVHIGLKEILRERKMTQRQLALLTGLRQSTISSLCKNQVDRVYFNTLAIICLKLNISVEQVLIIQDTSQTV
ncbi:helix-turn-helix transcriptional regulator [Paenibacillus sp. FSL P4-0338]|uniref:helix-turn-helix domain-containing protein n=1 Tax=Paenibacillus sp. FSL P4-0338 TaxID=2921635 RepID=UPI0030FA8455